MGVSWVGRAFSIARSSESPLQVAPELCGSQRDTSAILCAGEILLLGELLPAGCPRAFLQVIPKRRKAPLSVLWSALELPWVFLERLIM